MAGASRTAQNARLLGVEIMKLKAIALAGTMLFGMQTAIAGVAFAESDDVNWTGVYVGGNLGGTVGHSNIDIPAYPAKFNISEGSFSVGGQVGANWQATRWLLLGVEGDGEWMNEYGSHADGNGSEKFATRYDARYSARGRI